MIALYRANDLKYRAPHISPSAGSSKLRSQVELLASKAASEIFRFNLSAPHPGIELPGDRVEEQLIISSSDLGSLHDIIVNMNAIRRYRYDGFSFRPLFSGNFTCS